ncbi:UNVERIFIED_ORG: hypothetical protein E4P37_12755 [Bacillus sp. AZ43]
MLPHESDTSSAVHREDLRAQGALWQQTSRRGALVGAPRFSVRLREAVRVLTARPVMPAACC